MNTSQSRKRNKENSMSIATSLISQVMKNKLPTTKSSKNDNDNHVLLKSYLMVTADTNNARETPPRTCLYITTTFYVMFLNVKIFNNEQQVSLYTVNEILEEIHK